MYISSALIKIMFGFILISFPNYLDIMKDIMSKGPRSGSSKFFDYIANVVNQLSTIEPLFWVFYILGFIFIIAGVASLWKNSKLKEE